MCIRGPKQLARGRPWGSSCIALEKFGFMPEAQIIQDLLAGSFVVFSVENNELVLIPIIGFL